MTALTASRVMDFKYRTDPRGDILQLPVAAAETIYQNGFVGVDPAGYAKAFVPGDLLVGVADEEVDNSAGTAAAKTVKIVTSGVIEHTLSGAALTDIGKPVYATDDATIALTGHPDAYVGRITRYAATSTVDVALRSPSEKPPNGVGSAELILTGFEHFPATGATAGDEHVGAFEFESILGPGLSGPTDGENAGHTMAFDATGETALASVRTPHEVFPVDKGITFEVELHLTDNGDDEMDVDWGLGTALTTNSEADIDHGDMVQLACFHLDGLVANILVQSDDDTDDVAAVDTTIDNSLSVAKKFKIIVRPTGAVEFWIDGVRAKATTTFAVLSTAMLAAFINMEKVTDAGVASLIFRNLRVAGGCAA